MLTLLFGVIPGHTQTRVAVVIGNSSYKNVPALPNPVNDAGDIAASLERVGFTVRRLMNGSSENMRTALRDFVPQARRSEIALIFFAGHGIEVGGENWLLPVDAELNEDVATEQEAIALRSLLRPSGSGRRFQTLRRNQDATTASTALRSAKRRSGTHDHGAGYGFPARVLCTHPRG